MEEEKTREKAQGQHHQKVSPGNARESQENPQRSSPQALQEYGKQVIVCVLVEHPPERTLCQGYGGLQGWPIAALPNTQEVWAQGIPMIYVMRQQPGQYVIGRKLFEDGPVRGLQAGRVTGFVKITDPEVEPTGQQYQGEGGSAVPRDFVRPLPALLYKPR